MKRTVKGIHLEKNIAGFWIGEVFGRRYSFEKVLRYNTTRVLYWIAVSHKGGSLFKAKTLKAVIGMARQHESDTLAIEAIRLQRGL